MGHSGHRAHDRSSVRWGVVTVSDTRAEERDEGGRILREGLTMAGHEIVGYEIVADEPERVVGAVRAMIDRRGAEAVVTTGGTGIAPRDTTYEAIEAILVKRLDGFGELFRMLSFKEIGPAAMLSRAVAGTVARADGSGAVLFALPGSPAAVRLALAQLIVPEIGHLVGLLRSKGEA